jgi:hypothetical protein
MAHYLSSPSELFQPATFFDGCGASVCTTPIVMSIKGHCMKEKMIIYWAIEVYFYESFNIEAHIFKTLN